MCCEKWVSVQRPLREGIALPRLVRVRQQSPMPYQAKLLFSWQRIRLHVWRPFQGCMDTNVLTYVLAGVKLDAALDGLREQNISLQCLEEASTEASRG